MYLDRKLKRLECDVSEEGRIRLQLPSLVDAFREVRQAYGLPQPAVWGGDGGAATPLASLSPTRPPPSYTSLPLDTYPAPYAPPA